MILNGSAHVFLNLKKKNQQSLKNDPGTQQKLGMLYRIKHCFLGNNLCINSEGLYVKFASELPEFLHT
jgi:hypothetical protein